MDAFGNLAKEGLEAGRRIELFGFPGIAECGIVSLLRLPAGLLRAAAGGVGIVEIHLAFGDTRFDVVELGVKDANLPEVTAFEGL